MARGIGDSGTKKGLRAPAPTVEDSCRDAVLVATLADFGALLLPRPDSENPFFRGTVRVASPVCAVDGLYLIRRRAGSQVRTVTPSENFRVQSRSFI